MQRPDELAQVVPEPSAEERQALLAALAELRAREEHAALDPWSAAGLREATENDAAI